MYQRSIINVPADYFFSPAIPAMIRRAHGSWHNKRKPPGEYCRWWAAKRTQNDFPAGRRQEKLTWRQKSLFQDAVWTSGPCLRRNIFRVSRELKTNKTNDYWLLQSGNMQLLMRQTANAADPVPSCPTSKYLLLPEVSRKAPVDWTRCQ